MTFSMFVLMNADITLLFVIGLGKTDDHDSRPIPVPARPATSLTPAKNPLRHYPLQLLPYTLIIMLKLFLGIKISFKDL